MTILRGRYFLMCQNSEPSTIFSTSSEFIPKFDRFLFGTCKLSLGTCSESLENLEVHGPACLYSIVFVGNIVYPTKTPKTRCTCRCWMVAPPILRTTLRNTIREIWRCLLEVNTTLSSTRCP